MIQENKRWGNVMAGFAGYTLSGSRWPSSTITYSFATSTAATSPGGPFSAVFTPPMVRGFGGGPLAYALTDSVGVELGAWSLATGIAFRGVPDSTSPGSLPDIRIGFGNLGGGALSAFSATSVGGVFQPGAELLLQDTRVTPLTSNGAYQGTQARFADVVDSAVGHALGLAAATGPVARLGFSDPAVVATSDGSASPAFVNAAGVAGVEALYGPTLSQAPGGADALGTVDTDPGNAFSAAHYGIPGGTARARIPTSALVSLTADGTLQLQANQPGGAAVAVPGVRAIGESPNTSGLTSPSGLSDPTGNAESIARLYQAVLGRSPDIGGLYGYAQQVDQGTISLAQVADLFISSPEFLTKAPAAVGTGALAQATFVDNLYRNLFGRPLDPGPGAGYVTALLASASRGVIANGIAQSLEARRDYLPYEGDRSEGTLYRFYEAAFGRAPDASGEATYVPLLDAGMSPQEFAASLLGSPEYSRTPGSASNGGFLVQTYQGALGRQPDAGGLASYAGEITSGVSRAQVLTEIANSSEARAHSALATHDGWVYLPKALG